MMRRNMLDCMTLVGTTPSRFDGEKAYVSTGAVDCDHIDYTQTESVTYGNRPSRANLSVTEGDILFAKMCGTKKTLQISKTMADHLYSTGFCAVRANEAVMIPELLYHLLASEQFLSQKDQNSSGATQKAITNAGLKKITVNVPSLDEQHKLAAKLDYIEDMTAKRHEQLVYLEQLVKSRFIELFGDPVENNCGWQTQPLESVCKTIVDCPHSTPSYTDEDTGYMCIRTSIVKKNRIMWDEIEYIPEHEYYQRIQRKRPEKGDVVYTREGAILGIAAMIDRECNVALGQRSMLLSPNTAMCLPQFLCAAMNFESFLRKALGGVSGSASPHINVGDIKAFAIILPPMELQEQFAAFVEQTDKSKYYSRLPLALCRVAATLFGQEWMKCQTSNS